MSYDRVRLTTGHYKNTKARYPNMDDYYDEEDDNR